MAAHRRNHERVRAASSHIRAELADDGREVADAAAARGDRDARVRPDLIVEPRQLLSQHGNGIREACAIEALADLRELQLTHSSFSLCGGSWSNAGRVRRTGTHACFSQFS